MKNIRINQLSVVFTLSTLTSAFLLFLVQPMFAKMTLPLLGGTPAIWNTAIVFYQTVLLLGYAYTHFTSRFLTFKTQAIIQIGLMSIAVIFLPISVSIEAQSLPNSHYSFWLLGLYTLSIGFPFFVLSTLSPLIQKWFSQTTHVNAPNPYFLYSASNFGSLSALLLYPFVIESKLGLVDQGIFWTYVYLILVLLIATSAWLVWRNHRPQERQAATYTSISWNVRLRWTILAFVPSSLLISVTTHLTTDLAAVPLLWLIPLTLFLITFILVFANKTIIPHNWMVKVQSYGLLALPLVIYFNFSDFKLNLFIHTFVFFLCAMVCHGELAHRKPAAENLTEFYLFMSIGGALGGIFTAIIAPIIFNDIYEYSIGIVLACLIRPILIKNHSHSLLKELVIPIIVGALALGLVKIVLALEISKRSTTNYSSIDFCVVCTTCIQLQRHSFKILSRNWYISASGLLGDDISIRINVQTKKLFCRLQCSC